jgi:hypothetical protein
VTWFKVDDKLHAHPKWWALTPNAKALWTTAGAWCASYKTDGAVLTAQLAILAPQVGLTVQKMRAAVVELVVADLWVTTDSGWAFHNWTDFNPPRATLDKEAAIEKERKKIQNDPDLKTAVRVRDGDLCRYCGEQVNFAARTGHLAGRYDHVIPVTKGGKTTLSNVVVCCDYDNRRKYNKTLDEAEMTLLDPGTTAPTGADQLRNGSVFAQSKTRRRLGSGAGPGQDGTGLAGPVTGTGSGSGLAGSHALSGSADPHSMLEHEVPPPWTDEDLERHFTGMEGVHA